MANNFDFNGKLLINSDGNVGIKATPSAWASGYSVLNVGAAAAVSWTGAGANDFSFSTNAYYDTTDNRWEYRGTGDGSARYSMTALSYEHRWYNAPVGTANAAISYTQAMTLTGGGNLLIGTTTDSGAKLTVNGETRATSFTNAGALGTGSNNARNHFTQLNAGSASPATGWIAAAFGDALADRIVIGQWTNGAQEAIFGSHTANLDDWADTNYVSKNHKFYYNGDWGIVPALTINTSGNILIGTTSDNGNKLRVQGTTWISGNVYTNGQEGIELAWTGNTLNDNRIGRIRPISTSSQNPYAGGLAFDYYKYDGAAYNFFEGMRLNGAGNVGIGTTGLVAKLDVAQDTRTGAHASNQTAYFTGTMNSGTTGTSNANIEFRHSNASQGIGFGYNTIYQTGDNANNELNILSRGTSPITLNAYAYSTGNVLINTTTDSGYKLAVNGSAGLALSSGGIVVASYDGNTGNIKPSVANGSVLISDDSGTTGRGTEFLNNGGLIASSTQSVVASFNSSVTDGIGWIQVNTTQQTTASGTSPAAIELVGLRGTSTHGRHAFIGAEGVDGTTYRTQIKFKIRAEDSPYQWSTLPTQMVIDGNGNVGINTTSPQDKLEIKSGYLRMYDPSSSVGAGYSLLWSSDNGGSNVTYAAIDGLTTSAGVRTGDLRFLTSNAGGPTEKVRIMANGNVGIGTSAPTDRLHVRVSDTYGAVRIGGGNGAGNSRIFIEANGDDNYIDSYGDNTHKKLSIAGSPIILSVGNVGIGNTAPATKLRVESSGSSFTSPDNNNVAAVSIYNSNNSSVNAHAVISLRTQISGGNPFISFDVENETGYSVGMENTSNQFRIAYGWNSLTTYPGLTITPSISPNVLIGTTTDGGYKLDVAGNFRASTTGSVARMQTSTNASEVLQLSNSGGDSGSVQGITHLGINFFSVGTNSPVRITAYQNGTSGYTGGMYFSTRGVNSDSAPTEAMRITHDQLIGLGPVASFTTTHRVWIDRGSSTYAVYSQGSIQVNAGAIGVGVTPSATSGRIDAGNDIVAYSTSDQRLKENITPIANALDKVKALTGVEFDWKEETKDVHGYEGHDVGVIAQEVQAVLPEAVRTNDSGYLSVRYEKMIALLVEANKELASRVEELEKKLK